jgi:6-phosphogluconate dehydrogenase
MIHNGIEYAEMQLIAEVYSILKVSFTNGEISKLFYEWNIENTGNYLLEITSKILTKKEGNNYLIDLILDKSGNKGTGSWSSKTALDLGFPSTMITAAVFDRYISSFKKDRVQFSKKITRETHLNSPKIEDLKKAYQFARIINHHQGFLLMKEASKKYNWDLNFSEIARIWTNGCIIRSKFMEKSIEILKNNNDYLKDNETFNFLHDNEDAILETLKYGLENRIPLNTLNASFNYWISITSEKLPANIIQAQRDFFGAHTYQRIDKKEQEYFHTTW